MAVFFSKKTLSMISVSSISIVSATLGATLYWFDTMESKYVCPFWLCERHRCAVAINKTPLMAYRAMQVGIICSILFVRLIMVFYDIKNKLDNDINRPAAMLVSDSLRLMTSSSINE